MPFAAHLVLVDELQRLGIGCRPVECFPGDLPRTSFRDQAEACSRRQAKLRHLRTGECCQTKNTDYQGRAGPTRRQGALDLRSASAIIPFAGHTLERQASRLLIHKTARVGVSLDPVAARRLDLRAVVNGSPAESLSGVGSHLRSPVAAGLAGRSGVVSLEECAGARQPSLRWPSGAGAASSAEARWHRFSTCRACSGWRRVRLRVRCL